MARLLAAVGELSYNGITFPGPIRAGITATPQYDGADRSVKYVKYVLKVETYFCHDDTALVSGAPAVGGLDPHVNNVMDYIRLHLSQPGARLRIKEKGFGLDVVINGSATAGRLSGKVVYDAENGPKPRVLSWQPVGDNRTAKVIWEVEFNIPESNETKDETWPNARTFNVDWSINERGLTVRTITGMVEVAIKRNPLVKGIRADWNADDYRHHTEFALPLGFVRSQKFSLSEDRRTLHFTITDRELESDFAFTPGTLTMAATHEIDSSFLDGQWGGFVKWDCTINATITLPKNVSASVGFNGVKGQPQRHGRRWAWVAFKEILDQKIWSNASKGMNVQGKHLKVPGKIRNVDATKAIKREMAEGGATFLPNKINIKEDLYGRSFDFSFSYIIFCMPDYIFETSRILHPDGPTGRKDILEWQKYLDYTGGRYFAATPTVGASNVKSQPFGRRGELGGQELAGREGSYYGSIPQHRDPVWDKDITYDYCNPRNLPAAKFGIPEKNDGYNEQAEAHKPSGVTPNVDEKSSKELIGSYAYPEDGILTGAKHPTSDKGSGGDIKLLGYVCNYEHVETGRTIMHTRLGKTSASNYAQDTVETMDEGGTRYRAVTKKNELAGADRPKIQTLGPPQHLVRITGYAYQMGYTRIPPSTLKWGENCTLYRISKKTTVSQVAKGELPVYLTTWDILYNADNSPNGEVHTEINRITKQQSSGMLSNQST